MRPRNKDLINCKSVLFIDCRNSRAYFAISQLEVRELKIGNAMRYPFGGQLGCIEFLSMDLAMCAEIPDNCFAESGLVQCVQQQRLRTLLITLDIVRVVGCVE